MITRRDLLKIFPIALSHLAVGGGVGVATYQLAKPKEDLMDTVAEISLEYVRAEDVINAFIHANSGFLMASYSVFFPEFLARNGSNAPDALEAKLKKIDRNTIINPHRADVLPAITAAHLLPHTTDRKIAEKHSEKIISALKDPRREVREIILQNLISTARADFDSVRFYNISRDILEAVENVFKDLRHDETLFTPALLGMEYLLNAKNLIGRIENREKEKKEILRILKYSTFPRHNNSWYFLKLYQTHRKTFNGKRVDPLALPPQSSEALMGWPFSGRGLETRDYMSLLALSRVKLAKNTFEVAEGTTSGTAAMSREEALLALPKTLDFIHSFDLMSLIKNNPYDRLVRSNDNELYKFISKELPFLVDNRKKIINNSPQPPMSSNGINLGQLVPFSQHTDKNLLRDILTKQDHGYEKAIGYAGLAAATSTFMTTEGVARLGKWLVKRNHSEESESKPDKDEVIELLEERGKSIDRGEFQGIEEDQQNLGSISEDVIR